MITHPPAINAAELNAISSRLQELDRWAKRAPALIKSYKTAGSYIFTTPPEVNKILVAEIGGGGGGGIFETDYKCSPGGSGVATLFELTVLPGQNINCIVGAKGAPGENGSSTSFNAVTVDGGNKGNRGWNLSNAQGADGGQGSPAVHSYQWLSTDPIFGGVSTMFGVSGDGITAQGTSKSSSVFAKMQHYGIIPFCIAVGNSSSSITSNVLPNGNTCYSETEIGNDPGSSGTGGSGWSGAKPGVDGGIFIYDITGVNW